MQIEINDKDRELLYESIGIMLYAEDLRGDCDYKVINGKSIIGIDEKDTKKILNKYRDDNNCSLVEAATSLYVDPNYKTLVKNQFLELFKFNKCSFTIKTTLLDELNRPKWIDVTLVIQQEDGIATKLLGVLSDITKRHYEFVALEEATRRDIFTGLFNKTNAFKLINKKIETSNKKTQGAFAILDIDGFKRFNDSYGHDVGDLVLESVAKSLSENISSNDIVGRFGGDEFILYIENYGTKEELRKNLEKLLVYKVGSHAVHTSIGISILNEDSTTFNRLFKHADEALYKAKNSGSKIAFYNEKE